MNNEIRILEILEEINSKLSNPTDEWMDMNTASEYSSVSKQTIRRAFRKAKLKVSDKTGKRLFKKADIDKWLRGK